MITATAKHEKIEALNLTARQRNCIKHLGMCDTTEELCLLTRAELLRWPNFGPLSLKTLEAELASRGLKLSDGGTEELPLSEMAERIIFIESEISKLRKRAAEIRERAFNANLRDELRAYVRLRRARFS